MIAHRVVHQAASLALRYPDASTVGSADLMRAALAQSAPRYASHFEAVLHSWETRALADLQAHYVEVFDLSRKHTLYLTYWTDGDTRRRGASLTAIKKRYRASGFLVDTGGELPDFLPMVLEYAAIADPHDGPALLQDFRRSLELLRLALVERSPAHAGVVRAVCATLPGASPADRQAVLAMAARGPAFETVGLEPTDPRLLPLAGTAAGLTR